MGHWTNKNSPILSPFLIQIVSALKSAETLDRYTQNILIQSRAIDE